MHCNHGAMMGTAAWCCGTCSPHHQQSHTAWDFLSHCSFAYGYATTSGGNNIWHLEGHKVIYPVGQYFATLEPSDQAVTFIPTHERVRAVRAMCLASTRKYAACIEDVFGEESQQVCTPQANESNSL